MALKGRRHLKVLGSRPQRVIRVQLDRQRAMYMRLSRVDAGVVLSVTVTQARKSNNLYSLLMRLVKKLTVYNSDTGDNIDFLSA